jgi:two-component system, cell cycle response regulator CtrA
MMVSMGDLRINLDKRPIEVNDGRVHLTGKEYKLLELLWRHKGTTLNEQFLLNHLYGSIDAPEPRIIGVFVCYLRFKLFKASEGRGGIKIEAVPGHGYVLHGA